MKLGEGNFPASLKLYPWQGAHVGESGVLVKNAKVWHGSRQAEERVFPTVLTAAWR
jgi:hypothetical protein